MPKSAASPGIRPREDRGWRVWAWVVVALLALTLPWLIDSLRSVETSSNDVMPWLPVDTAERKAYQVFEQAFGVEEAWMLSLDDSADLAAFDQLKLALEAANASTDPPLLVRIRSGSDFLRDLNERDANATRLSLSGLFFDLKGERPLIIAEATEHGQRHRQLVYEQVILKAAREVGREDDLRVTGSGFLGVMADAETTSTLRAVTPVTFALSALLALVLLRCLKLATIALVASGLSALLSIAIIHRSGESLSHLLVIVPSLAQLLALSNAIHFIHYYEDAYRSPHPRLRPWQRALSRAWLPAVAASLTTAIGFLSLLVSSVPVVATFSVFGALGVLGSLFVVLLVVPVGLILSHPRPRDGGWIELRLFPSLQRFLALRRMAVGVGVGLLLLLAASFPGLALLKTDARMENFFAKDSPFLVNHRWFDTEFGPMQACHLMGRFSHDVPLSAQWAFVATLQENLDAMHIPVKTLSPLSLASMGGARMSQTQDPAANAALLENITHRLREENMLAESAQGIFWKITVFHEAVPDFSGSTLSRELHACIATAKRAHPDSRGLWEVTGIQPLFADAQKALLRELLQSFLVAFILIAPLVILFLRSVKLGLIGILPNLFPIVVLFGVMGYFGVRLDIATMVTASVAFGVAVDDTIHFLVWTGRGLKDQSKPLSDVVGAAVCGSGPAILKTTLIISVGMLAFLLSDFVPSRRFAVCTSLILILAVIGDLIMLPALISGVFARSFVRKGPDPA